MLYQLNWRGEVFLVDDNFIGNKRNVKRLLPELAAWQRQKATPFSFTTEASVDLAGDEELMDQMIASGFNRVFLGIETTDTGSLSTANKHQNIRSPLLESLGSGGAPAEAGDAARIREQVLSQLAWRSRGEGEAC